MFSEIIQHAHPIVVHFPIALILLAVLLDLIRAVRQRNIPPTCRLFIWLLAAIGVAVAYYTGPGRDAFGVTNLIKQHATFAQWTMWATFLVVAIRLFLWWRKVEAMRGFGLVVYLLIAVLTAGLVMTTGYYGGKMVYDQGVGVKVNGKAVNPPKQPPLRQQP